MKVLRSPPRVPRRDTTRSMHPIVGATALEKPAASERRSRTVKVMRADSPSSTRDSRGRTRRSVIQSPTVVGSAHAAVAVQARIRTIGTRTLGIFAVKRPRDEESEQRPPPGVGGGGRLLSRREGTGLGPLPLPRALAGSRLAGSRLDTGAAQVGGPAHVVVDGHGPAVHPALAHVAVGRVSLWSCLIPFLKWDLTHDLPGAANAISLSLARAARPFNPPPPHIREGMR